MNRLPLHDATAPVACTLDDADLPARIELLERLRTTLTAVERTEHGLVLRLPDRPGVGAHVRRFAVDEKRCCPFWGFAIDAGDGELSLRWDGPPGASELLDRLHSWFTGEAPRPDIASLL